MWSTARAPDNVIVRRAPRTHIVIVARRAAAANSILDVLEDVARVCMQHSLMLFFEEVIEEICSFSSCTYLVGATKARTTPGAPCRRQTDVFPGGGHGNKVSSPAHGR